MGRIKDKKVASFVAKVKKKFNAKVLLFGSRARGEELKESDYDICVISEKFTGLGIRKRLEELYKMMISCPFNADLLALTPKEFKKLSTSMTIYGQVKREGVAI